MRLMRFFILATVYGSEVNPVHRAWGCSRLFAERPLIRTGELFPQLRPVGSSRCLAEISTDYLASRIQGRTSRTGNDGAVLFVRVTLLIKLDEIASQFLAACHKCTFGQSNCRILRLCFAR